jgi:hypothetical protein
VQQQQYVEQSLGHQQAQPQAPLQQHFPYQGLNGGWQSDKDVNDRRKMIARM